MTAADGEVTTTSVPQQDRAGPTSSTLASTSSGTEVAPLHLTASPSVVQSPGSPPTTFSVITTATSSRHPMAVATGHLLPDHHGYLRELEEQLRVASCRQAAGLRPPHAAVPPAHGRRRAGAARTDPVAHGAPRLTLRKRQRRRRRRLERRLPSRATRGHIRLGCCAQARRCGESHRRRAWPLPRLKANNVRRPSRPSADFSCRSQTDGRSLLPEKHFIRYGLHVF
ncbi:hypothetical protein DFH11DRAFT_1189378 [Phellopilus nigrolimitatus]|nr:hypothetical protein DFH11DRAFT_1189378 [Phellopilus nigrolimitatus]